jgi:hypothetical protein
MLITALLKGAMKAARPATTAPAVFFGVNLAKRLCLDLEEDIPAESG